MSTENDPDVDRQSGSDPREYPFGLSSRQLFVFVVVVGLIGPGLAVYALEQASLPLVADMVWILGYGTAVLVVWYVWIRPLDLIGSAARDISVDIDPAETDDGEHPYDALDASETAETKENNESDEAESTRDGAVDSQTDSDTK